MNQHEVPSMARFTKQWLHHAIIVAIIVVALIAIATTIASIHQYAALTNDLKQH